MDLFGLGFEVLLAFALTSTIIELTPGPNMAWLAIGAATEGRKPANAAVGGAALGLAAVGTAAALGLTALTEAPPLAYQVLRWGGVLYLLWPASSSTLRRPCATFVSASRLCGFAAVDVRPMIGPSSPKMARKEG